MRRAMSAGLSKGGSTEGVTLSELEHVAEEMGMPPERIREAALALDAPGTDSPRSLRRLESARGGPGRGCRNHRGPLGPNRRSPQGTIRHRWTNVEGRHGVRVAKRQGGRNPKWNRRRR